MSNQERLGMPSLGVPAPFAAPPMPSEADTQRLASRFKALGDPSRLRILWIVDAAPTGEVCACDFSEPLGLSQPTVSHHLKILVEAGLLLREKRGVWAYYSPAVGAVAELLAAVHHSSAA